MIPRGVSTAISLDAEWKYNDDAEEILDRIAYLLQYLNHAINFFLYVLANNNFRWEHQSLPSMHSTNHTYSLLFICMLLQERAENYFHMWQEKTNLCAPTAKRGGLRLHTSDVC